MMGEKARARLHAGLARLGVTGPRRRGHRQGDGRRRRTRRRRGRRRRARCCGPRVCGCPRWPPSAGLDVDDRGRIVTDASLRSVSHPNVYAVGDAAAIRQSYGVVHGTCQSGIPTSLHAAASIVRELKGKQPKPFRFGYIHQPVSLGTARRGHSVHPRRRQPGTVLPGRPAGGGVQRDGELQPMAHLPADQDTAHGWVDDVAPRRRVEPVTSDEQTVLDHRKLLFAIAYRLLGSAADAEDVVQDAWFKWSGGRSIPGLRPEGLPRPDRVELGDRAAPVDAAPTRKPTWGRGCLSRSSRGRCRRGRRDRRIGVVGHARGAGNLEPVGTRGVRPQRGLRLLVSRNR